MLPSKRFSTSRGEMSAPSFAQHVPQPRASPTRGNCAAVAWRRAGIKLRVVAGVEKRTHLLAQQRVHGHDVAGGAKAALPGPTSV
jgi:hypothetical protein